MKKLCMILPLVLVLCFTFSCQKAEEVAEEPAVNIAAEEAAIRAADRAWAKASEAKDVEAMTSFLAEDCVITGASEFRNKANFHEYWTEQFSIEGRESSWTTEKVFVADSGDLAYTLHKVENTRRVELESRITTGTTMVVWKKQPDGTWKAVAGF